MVKDKLNCVQQWAEIEHSNVINLDNTASVSESGAGWAEEGEWKECG